MEDMLTVVIVEPVSNQHHYYVINNLDPNKSKYLKLLFYKYGRCPSLIADFVYWHCCS